MKGPLQAIQPFGPEPRRGAQEFSLHLRLNVVRALASFLSGPMVLVRPVCLFGDAGVERRPAQTLGVQAQPGQRRGERLGHLCCGCAGAIIKGIG